MPDATLSCSFCLKAAHEVARLIEGPGTYICDECVAVCVQILDAALAGESGPGLPSYAALDDDELLARLPRMNAAAAQVEGSLRRWVGEARRRGVSWERVGGSLDMTRQSAWERFSKG